MAEWIQTTQGDLIFVPNVKKIFIDGVKLVIDHTSGEATEYAYQDRAAALVDYQKIAAFVGAAVVTSPVITRVTPNYIDDATLPQVVTITGIAFDATADFLIANYGTALNLATTFVNSTSCTVTIPGATAVGAYDLVYTDTPGATFVFPNGLILY